jgi:acyl-CoA synthetase (AMP-forming)/AMP-acid ligase II
MHSIEIPSVDIWDCLFERKEKPFPHGHGMYISRYLLGNLGNADPGQLSSNPFPSDIRSNALSFSANLQRKLGWKKGEVLPVFSPNPIDIPAVYWGSHWAGGVVSRANPIYTAEKLQYQLADSGTKVLVFHSALIKIATAAVQNVGILRSNVWVIDAQPVESGLQQQPRSILETKAAGSISPMIDSVTDTAFLIYSSGTTGPLKGAMATHTDVVADLHCKDRFMDHIWTGKMTPFLQCRQPTISMVCPSLRQGCLFWKLTSL